MAVTVAITEGFMVKLLEVSEQDSLTSIAEEHGIPHRHLMALQRNNKALHHSVILQRFCSATEDSRCLWHDAKQKEEETPSYAKIVPSLAVSCSPPCATKWQARRLSACAVRLTRPSEVLICPGRASDHAPASCENDDFALKLYWGRQRGLAVIFASDAMQCAQRVEERHFLGDDTAEGAPALAAFAEAACLLTATPPQKVLCKESSTPPLLIQQKPGSGVSGGLGQFCRKLAIPDDACSVEGPSTPDAEEADRVCMPATKRQRLAESSPGLLAATVSGTLYLL